MLEEILVIFACVFTSLVSLIIILYYLPKLRSSLYERYEASKIVKDILLELQDRLKQQDQKIMDQQVIIDLAQLKIDKYLSKINYKEYVDFGKKCFESCGRYYIARNFGKFSDLIYEFKEKKDL